MEASNAQKIATSPDELQDLQDDQVIHQITEPEPALTPPEKSFDCGSIKGWMDLDLPGPDLIHFIAKQLQG